ncbi:glycolate oxidase subunit GlcE [Amorphus orientalis]|uniref:Glycolate oxidase FAD binding subunit n=1 Tax=Amorphus orientalis TaxID=649198 RepID=A0AAE3VRR3_9HYPH|nr:glycolate oxidase subunit GlcE [Amorphus orientalis]MDQ0317559.1 glycolate oxidase FAD binding subunit [Amorphus orientalis]
MALADMRIETSRPDTPEAVREVVEWAVATETPLEVLGTGSKRAIGRPVAAGHVLDLSAVSGITLYEPEELVLSARAGTSLAEIRAALSEAGQELAFEPCDYSALLGGTPGEGTLGGLIAANLSGPRRIRSGAARDHALGIEAVSGRAEIFKSGGRVVKNVTGYDLARGLAGSWGTLAVLTAVTVKVLPVSEMAATLVLDGLSDAAAVKALSAALGSPADVSGAAHLPADTVAGLAGIDAPEGAVTAVRLEGFAASVRARLDALAALLKPFGRPRVLAEEPTGALWRGVRDCLAFAASSDTAVWRVSVAPSAGPELVAAIRSERELRAWYDWGGGLVWIETSAAGNAGAEAIRRAVADRGGGHATLIRAPEETRRTVAPFQPEAPGVAALSRRIKAQFDPSGVLNPNRMWTDH